MKCFVTGATGFIGSNLVHELVAQGHEVKALIRPNSNLRGLQGADVETVRGNIGDRPALVAAIKGCDWCFHVAASYHFWLPRYDSMYATNVDGTRNVLEAAHKAGCSRIVYTSTVGCIGLPVQTNGEAVLANETTPLMANQFNGHYKRSKFKAEVVAFELLDKGLPVVIVNPSVPIGPRDVKPTPTGRLVLDFLNHALPAYLDTGFNIVHVRDVVRGHILAAEKGRIGERYLLGNSAGNWTLKQFLDALSEITEQPTPRMKLPYSVALTAAYLDEGISWLSGRPPKAPLAGVRMARRKMYFDPAKAVTELGLPQSDPRQALVDAVEWFRANDYVRA